jgi:hypothetical protein
MRYFIVVGFFRIHREVTGVKLIRRQNASLGCALTNAFPTTLKWIYSRTTTLPSVPGRDSEILPVP